MTTQTQIARQTTLNEYINAAVSAFLATHPDTEIETVKNALRDGISDADAVYRQAVEPLTP